MKAMILAAGRGARLRPLTDAVPKALIVVGGKPLIVRHLQKLTAAGFCDIVINYCHLGEQIVRALGDGKKYGARICYSPEKTRLEAGGGIALALSRDLLSEKFLVVNADVFCAINFRALQNSPLDSLCHLVLVNNPPSHPAGDFSLDNGGLQKRDGQNDYTYSGVGVYQAALFCGGKKSFLPGEGGIPSESTAAQNDKKPLLPFLLNAVAKKQASGEYFCGVWHDTGAPQSLAAARNSPLALTGA